MKTVDDPGDTPHRDRKLKTEFLRGDMLRFTFQSEHAVGKFHCHGTLVQIDTGLMLQCRTDLFQDPVSV